VERLAGRLLQHMAFLSLPTGESVYLEQMEAREDCRAAVVDTGIVGVRNEDLPSLGDRAKGHRVLRLDDGTSRRYEGRFGGTDLVETFGPPRYLAIDECMAFLLHGSRGLKYVNIHDYPKWRGLEDLLVLDSRPGGQEFRAGRREEPFVLVSLPDRGIAAASERFRGFAVLAAAPEGCLAVLHGDYLVGVNFSASPASCAARGPVAPEVRVFRGRTAVAGGTYEWRGDLEPLSAAYLELRYTIRGDCDGMVADVPSAGIGTLSNRSARRLSLEVYRAGKSEPRRVTLEPGRFLDLE